MATKRDLQKAKTKEKIILTSIKLFEENGFSKVGTIDIAKKAKVSHGTVFSHFKTRDKLIIEVINRLEESVCGIVRKEAAQGNSLKNILEGHIDGLIQHEKLYKIILQEEHTLPVEGAALLIETNAAVAWYIYNKIELPSHLPFHQLFNIWSSLVEHHILYGERMTESDSSLKKFKNDIIESFLFLIDSKYKLKVHRGEFPLLPSHKITNCICCGMTMTSIEQHGKKDESIPYCHFCTNEDGTMLSFEQAIDWCCKWISKMLGYNMNKSKLYAEKITLTKPAWKGH